MFVFEVMKKLVFMQITSFGGVIRLVIFSRAC